jgi:hypothetical protein
MTKIVRASLGLLTLRAGPRFGARCLGFIDLCQQSPGAPIPARRDPRLALGNRSLMLNECYYIGWSWPLYCKVLPIAASCPGSCGVFWVV